MVSFAPVWHCMVPCGPYSPIYGPVWSCMVPHGPMQSSLVLYGSLWFRMIPYIPVWLWIVLNGPIWSCLVPYDALWSCKVFEILSSPIALLSPVRYQILADIESFAFFFRTIWHNFTQTHRHMLSILVGELGNMR